MKPKLIALAILSLLFIAAIVGLIVNATKRMPWSSSPLLLRSQRAETSVAPSFAGEADMAVDSYAYGRPGIAPMPPAYPNPGATKEEREKVGPKIIKNGSLSLRVRDVTQAFNEITAIAERRSGFVDNGQVRSGDRTPSASLTIRIPSAVYNETAADVQKLGLTLSSNVNSQDVTAVYVDAEARLRAARAEEAQYLDILKNARSIEDTLNVTARLADVRMRIEQLDGQLRGLKDRTQYATLSVSLQQEARIEVPSGSWRPLSTLREAGRMLILALQSLVNVLIVGIIFLVGFLAPIVLVLYGVYRLIRWIWNRRK